MTLTSCPNSRARTGTFPRCHPEVWDIPSGCQKPQVWWLARVMRQVYFHRQMCERWQVHTSQLPYSSKRCQRGNPHEISKEVPREVQRQQETRRPGFSVMGVEPASVLSPPPPPPNQPPTHHPKLPPIKFPDQTPLSDLLREKSVGSPRTRLYNKVNQLPRRKRV